MMHALKSKKLSFINLHMGFSKLKMNQPGVKPIPAGLKVPPAFKTPTLDKNSKLNINANEKAKTVKVAGVEMNIKEDTFTPVLKQKHAVVTIMGHVDHGKTTLIDFLRKSDIAQKQDGGITQRIGAFRINCLGERITFIDTPGHEAFTNMRQRGASVTDLIVLVISATEGVKKQTLQVIDLIKKMQIPLIVAINKIDLPQANPEEVQAELEKIGLNLQINGGDIPVVHISAKNGLNVDLLCQLIIEETKNKIALFNGMAEASVLEAFQTKEGLNSMTIIMEKGTLKIGSILVMGKESFKVKTILDDRGQSLKEAYPGEAVQVVGIPFIPAPGDQVLEVENEKKAKLILGNNIKKQYEQSRNKTENKDKDMFAPKIKFENYKERKAFCRGVREVWMNKFEEEEEKILQKIEELKKKAGNEVIDNAILELQQQLEAHKLYVYEYLRNTGDSPQNLNFIIKFGDRGMEETILMQLEKLKPSIEQQTKVKLNLIKTNVGDVTVGDIEEARNCSAKIFTYGAGVSPEGREYLDGDEMPRTHKLIHNLLKDIKQTSFNKKLSCIKGTQRGRCEVADMFTIKQKKATIQIPGVKVLSGKITKKCKGYVFRGGVPISAPLDINFMKSFKKQVLELRKGEEGTLGFLQEVTIQKGDELAFYQQV